MKWNLQFVILYVKPSITRFVLTITLVYKDSNFLFSFRTGKFTKIKPLKFAHVCADKLNKNYKKGG